MPITEGGRFSPENRIVSPGVFTRENDLSGIAQGVADIGGVVVAPFPKGPGFSPTLINNLVDLEEKFGVADGVYYGPYTAKEYLKEKGFVTVCRVGALTGYQQKYPFVIYAVRGDWLRAQDIGAVNSSSSFFTPVSGALSTGYSGSINYVTGSGGRLEVTTSLSVTFQSTIASATFNAVGANSNSGSNLYYGQTISLGTVYLNIGSGSFTISSAVESSTSVSPAEKVRQALISGSLRASIAGASYVDLAESPFDNAWLSGSLFAVSSAGTCNPTLNFYGLVSGSFGTRTGQFNSNGSPTFDPCTGTWTTGSYGIEFKVLAVLADTQNATINSSLQAPGFNGSSMITASNNAGASAPVLDFNLNLSSSDGSGYGVYQFSLDESSTKYITNVFGKNPRAGNTATHAQGTKIEAAYLYKIFEDEIASVVANSEDWYISGSVLPDSTFSGEPLNFTDEHSLDLNNGDSEFGLTNAYTPWVLSQKIAPWNGGNATRFPLFRVWTQTDGTNANTSYKIEVSNVKLAGTVTGTDWGSFTLTVRKYGDTDRRPTILEQFPNLTLDPDSPNFIARRIGDRYNFIDFKGKIIEFGTFDNNSRYIYIEMAANPYPESSIPYGFEAYSVPVNSAAGYWTPPVAYSKASVYGLNPGKYPSGVVFDDAPTGADAELLQLYPTKSAGVGVATDNEQYFAPLPDFGANSSTGRNSVFALDNDYQINGVGTGSFLSGDNIVPATLDRVNETTYVKMRKFVFGFQGGFDGQSPAIPINVGGDIVAGNTQGLNCATINSAGSIAYKQAVGALGNPDEFDINLIVTPGIIHSQHSYVTNLVVDVCEARGDCFYILDLYVDDGNPTSGQIDEVVELASEFDTNYAATYYPWIKIKDENINKIITVPPSVILPSVYASNDKVAGEWWAPAGLSRGGITQAKQVTDRLTHPERDVLYEGKVNPIAAFPGSGISVWGQKTLQVKSSALDRVNVRRLLINIKKFFASTGKFLVFEQNTAQTRNRFLAIVNPYLEGIQQRSGLYAFQVVMDDSNNTPDLIDRNILYGQIFLKPTKASEFIILDFNILPTGAQFPTV